MKTQDPEVIVNQYGNKARQIQSREDRSYDYKNMLYDEDSLYSIDVDLICIKYERPKIPTIVAGLELTLINNYQSRYDIEIIDDQEWKTTVECRPHPNFFKSIMTRYRNQGQGNLSVFIISKHNAPSVIVAFSKDLMHFYLYNLTKDNNKWFYQNKPAHLIWHYKIRNQKIPDDFYKRHKILNTEQESFIINT
ncbi:MAG: hypothetical protein EBR82_33890 [Caulobacteraceae bacterium]|nr:hypothetical protein [Caulobacteraceae bacterium]